MSLLIGGCPSDVSKMENRERHNGLTAGFYAMLDYDPPSGIRGLLFACLIFRKNGQIEDSQIEDLKNIAKCSLSHGEYITWLGLFTARLIKHREALQG